MVNPKSLLNLKKFKLGDPDNPGAGRPVDEFAKLVREKKGLPEELFKIIFAKAQGKGSDSLKAAEFMVERGWGKAPMQIESDTISEIMEDLRKRFTD